MTKIGVNSLEEKYGQSSSSEVLSLFHRLKNHKKKIVALFGTAIILIGVMISNLGVLNSPPDVGMIKIPPPAEKITKISKYMMDIQILGGALLNTKNWAIQPVRSLIGKWNILERDEQMLTKQLAWFQKFSTGLTNQVTRQRTLSDSGDQQAIRRKTELLALVRLLGLSMVSMEAIDQEDKVQSPLARTITKEQDASKLSSEKISDTSPSGQEINKADLKDIIAKYVAAFESGQTAKIIDLFASDEHSIRKKPLTKIADEIAHIIHSSVSRKIDFNPIKWNNNHEVISEGRYTSVLTSLDDGIQQQLTADIRLTLRQVLNQTLITNFIVSKQTIVDISPPKISQQKLATGDAGKKITNKSNIANGRPAYPTRAELQDLMARYVKTYQDGDVKGLVSLFTKNKSSTPEQVSQKALMEYNYSELFESTTERYIYITDVKWSYKNNKAIGKGRLMLEYNDTMQNGNILIVAERNQQRIGFKNLFHIIDQN